MEKRKIYFKKKSKNSQISESLQSYFLAQKNTKKKTCFFPLGTCGASACSAPSAISALSFLLRKMKNAKKKSGFVLYPVEAGGGKLRSPIS